MLQQFANEALSGGFVSALALVCLVQYGYHVYRLRLARRQHECVQRHCDELEQEMEVALEDALLFRFETEFLRQFVSQTKLDHAVSVLLEHLVPDPSDGFAALFLFDDGRPRVHRTRGLDHAGKRSLKIDRETLREVVANGHAVLEAKDVAARQLVPVRARNVGSGRLVLLLVGEKTAPVGVVMTTSLYPAGIPFDRQLALAGRMMATIATNIRWARTLEVHETELRSTNEILELRAITDRRFPSPLAMVEAFVDRLRRMIGLDRGALYLAARDGKVSSRAIVRCGTALASGAEGRCRELEETIAECGLGNPLSVTMMETEDLARIGVATLVQGAIVAPVRREAITMGVVVFTGREAFEFDDSRAKLVEWACGHLGDSLDRVLHHADTERRAKQDGLTGLANRREFDERIAREVNLASAMGNTVSLLLIDLDHFKKVNDTYGHRAGDDVLKATAHILQRGVARGRAEDRSLIARYGGEELAIVFPGMNSFGANRIAEDLRAMIEHVEIPSGNEKIRVTASIGVAACPATANDVEGLIAAADAALYRAKELGRNRVVCAAPQHV